MKVTSLLPIPHPPFSSIPAVHLPANSCTRWQRNLAVLGGDRGYRGNKSDERERGQNNKPCRFNVVVEPRGLSVVFSVFDSP